MSGYRASLPTSSHFHTPCSVPALGPCGDGGGVSLFLPYHISTLCPYVCFLCPANSIDSAYPSRPWSNSTSSLNPRSLGGCQEPWVLVSTRNKLCGMHKIFRPLCPSSLLWQRNWTLIFLWFRQFHTNHSFLRIVALLSTRLEFRFPALLFITVWRYASCLISGSPFHH